MAINAIDFQAALDEIESSKGISKETILQFLEESLIKAYRKQLGGDDADVRVNLDIENGIIEMYQAKKVVKEVEDDFLEISVSDANALDASKKYKAGDEFLIYASVEDLRKATAMSVKSMLKQKFAEAEKGILYEAFKDKIDTIITGKVEKVDDNGISVNIGKTSAYLTKKELIGKEQFIQGETIKVYVAEVSNGGKGAQIIVSRSREGFLRCLFAEEIHDVYDGTVLIKKIAREAGERSKVAVYSNDLAVDPVGACIGPSGGRIQKILSQLGNGGVYTEKIDIIAYSDNTELFIMDSLKPAVALGICYDADNKKATVVVKDDALFLAIGRHGVNVKLAAKITGVSLDIKTESDAINEGLEFVSYESVKLIEEEKKAALRMQMAAKEEVKVQDVLRGLPEGYIAPQDRVYDENIDNGDDDIVEALEVEADIKEEIAINEVIEEKEIKEETPTISVSETLQKEPEVVEHKEVKTTTSIEELEKSLASESSRKSNKPNKKNFKKNNKKDEDEEDDADDKPTIATGERMSIYTEEELRQIEEEEELAQEDEDEEVDYDEFDEYYEDDR